MSLPIHLFTQISFAKPTCLILFETMIIYWITLKYPKLPILRNLSWVGTLSANLILFFILASRWLISGYFPLSNLYESLLFLSWCLLFILKLIESKTNSKIIGAVVLPIILLIISFATLVLPKPMQYSSPLVPSLQSNWLMMHVSMMMISYATLIVGSLLSILYLFFTFLNKNNNDSSISIVENVNSISFLNLKQINNSKLSLLEIVDTWSYRIIGLGFPFLTIGIISGAVWANEAWGSYWSWDPKETWALITWLVFAIYLHSRLIKGWQGKQAAVLGSCGFFVIWICYLGVNFLGKGLHSYGWVL
jgi:cytochrome c-type biogenesis protein CcsB